LAAADISFGPNLSAEKAASVVAVALRARPSLAAICSRPASTSGSASISPAIRMASRS
jgi:hypothetical protein